MKVVFIRVNICTQGETNLYQSFDKTSSSLFDFLNKEKSFVQEVMLRNFAYIQIGTFGWERGSKFRIKHLNTFEKLFAYLNKLHSGGWLSDDDYSAARGIALELQFCNIPGIC